MPLRTRCGTSRLPCMSLGVRAQGLGPRGGGTALAITICSVLPSVPYDAVGPPKFILLSRLNIQPARLPVNASPLLSRTTTHDSGPIWFATPSLGGTCTRETYRFVPAHRLVKILERPAGQQFAPFQGLLESVMRVLPPLNVGEMTLRLHAALKYSQNSALDLRRTLNGAEALFCKGIRTHHQQQTAQAPAR